MTVLRPPKRLSSVTKKNCTGSFAEEATDISLEEFLSSPQAARIEIPGFSPGCKETSSSGTLLLPLLTHLNIRGQLLPLPRADEPQVTESQNFSQSNLYLVPLPALR